MGNEDRIDTLRTLADRMLAVAGRRVPITHESARIVAQALHAYADHLERPIAEYPNFTVDVWENGYVLEELAACSNALVARAAFEKAVQERPNRHVTLRHRTRMMAEHRGHESG